MTYPLPGANWSYLHTLRLVATTGLSGFALANGTPNILTWTAPNDGQLHRVIFIATLMVTSTQTGGTVQGTYQPPTASTTHFSQLFPGGSSAGTSGVSQFTVMGITGPGSTVTVQQTSAQTAGAAVLYAEIWAM